MPNFTMQAVAKLPSISGNEEDAVINTFTYYGGGSGNTPAIVAAAFHTRPIDYYIDDFGADKPLGSYLSPSLDRSANVCSVSWREVNLALGTVGAIVRTDFFTLPTLSGESELYPLPRESCIVASHHGDLGGLEEVIPVPPTGPEGDIHPAARVRGRRFIGPLNTTAAANLDSILRPSSEVTAIIILAEQNSSDGGAEVVWSRANAAQAVVVGGWVDNELDTQRRRGQRPTSRSSWAAT